jgi:hypothetical protein
MTPELLTSVAASVLSLVFAYAPGVSEAYASLRPVQKRLVMLGLLAGVAAGMFGAACLGWAPLLGIEAACSRQGAVMYLRLFFAALAANQSTFLLAPRRA